MACSCRCGFYAASAGGGPVCEQLQARATTNEAMAAISAVRRRTRTALWVGVGRCNVQHYLELEQRCAGGHRVRALAGVRLDRRTVLPRLERFVGLPRRHHEVTALALDWAQELKAQEPGLIVDCVRSVCEPFLQFRACIGRDLDRVDLHHGHVLQATVPSSRVARAPALRTPSSRVAALLPSARRLAESLRSCPPHAVLPSRCAPALRTPSSRVAALPPSARRLPESGAARLRHGHPTADGAGWRGHAHRLGARPHGARQHVAAAAAVANRARRRVHVRRAVASRP